MVFNQLRCEPCNPSGSQTFYAIQNTGNSQPSVYNGYLNLVVNNKVYTNSNLTTLASQGHYLAEYSGTQEYECYSINSSGVVVSVSEIQECDDRES